MLLNKAENLITAIVAKICKTTKQRQKFLKHILILYMGLRGKYNFINMARYGLFTEQTCRNQMSRPYFWAEFNKTLIQQCCSEELILAFDPSYLRKSRKKTAHVGHFWSGKDQAVKPGIEVAALAVVDVKSNTALRYMFTGKQHQGRGRKRKYADKVDVDRIDRCRIRFCFEESDDVQVFSGIVNSVNLERLIRIAYLQNFDKNGFATSHAIFFSTDLNLCPVEIFKY